MFQIEAVSAPGEEPAEFNLMCEFVTQVISFIYYRM